jgi:sec-independent protein translocase protein TatC
MPQLDWTQVGLMFDLQKNTQIVVQLLAAAMVVFQIPLVLTALMMVGILKRRQVWGALRYVIIGVFVLSAVITPPDLVSQIALAGPLIVLLLLSLLIAKVLRFGEET